MTKICCENFGSYINDTGCETPIFKYTLDNGWLTLQVMTYGATVTSLKVPDQNHFLEDVVLGFDTLEDYFRNESYVGATIGRVTNRIEGAKFTLNNQVYSLNMNNPPNHLHGGYKGFDKMVWDSTIEENKLVLSYTSKDGEEGYPGEVKVKVIISVSKENEVIFEYKASSTKSTPLSLTNHSYFNLSGHKEQELIYDHLISVTADSYTPTNENNIPTGEIKSVIGTAFDLRKPVAFGESFKKLGDAGFDHNFCILKGETAACCVYHPKSGRKIEVTTTMPGLQLYTANFFPSEDTLKGKQGQYYKKHGAFCLETQHYPNAVNQSNFPNSVLHPGDFYHHTTVYKFTTN